MPLWGPVDDESLKDVTWGDKLAQSQPWTVIEDEESLANLTMLQASLAFQKWVNTTGVHETQGAHALSSGRNFQFFYVNDESIESVINPLRASECSGNFLVLVDLQAHLLTRDEKEADYRAEYNADQDFRDILADESDRSWKLVRANEFKRIYFVFLAEWDPWFRDSYDEFPSAPYVHPASTYGFGDVDEDILYPSPIGYNVYKMLNQIYGPDHIRSVCFEADEAQTGLQRICGYAGGYRKDKFTYPRFL